jgi:hypothetical protein
MAIKIDVFLRRTNQTFEMWLRDNGVTTIDELRERAAFVGLACSAQDIAEAAKILEKRRPATPEVPVEPAQLDAQDEAVDQVSDGAIATPATDDTPPKRARRKRQD